MKVLAIIPARKGSKGVPGKNKAQILGKPLITYTIEAARKSELITDICVSTDDEFIHELTNNYRDIKLHKRDESLASDKSPIVDTVVEILNWIGSEYDAIMVLQPTSPLRTSNNIDESIKLLESQEKTNCVISVCEMQDVHPARMYWLDGGHLNSILPEFQTVRRQEIPSAYYRNGSIYIVRAESFLKKNSFMIPPITPYVMPTSWLVNIDEPHDLIIAEALMDKFMKGEL